MRGTSSSSVRSAASVPATKLRPTTPSAAPTYRPKVATRSPSPPPPARGTNREDLPRRPREAKGPPADAVGTGTNPTLDARPPRGSAALARTLTTRARGGNPRAEIDRSRSRPPMATNSRFTPKHGRFRESRARGRGAAPRATAPGTLIADAIARAPLVFGAVRGSGRTREAVWQSPARIATSRPCHAFSAGIYLQRPIARLNAQSSRQRESRGRIINADSDSLQSRACFPRARRRLSANLHSPRLPALRALERARSQSPPSTAIHTRWLPCRPRASSRRASARTRVDPHAAPETRIAPASRARDPPTRRAARLDPPASRSAPRRPRSWPSPRTSRSPARRARTRAAAPSGSSRCSCLSRGSSSSWLGRVGGPGTTTTRTRHRLPGLRIPKTIKKISPSRAAKTASAGTRPSPRTCEPRGGSRGETNGD